MAAFSDGNGSRSWSGPLIKTNGIDDLSPLLEPQAPTPACACDGLSLESDTMTVNIIQGRLWSMTEARASGGTETGLL